MTIKNFSNAVFEAAPAVLYISCSISTVINGITYILHRDNLSKILFSTSIAGMVIATVIHKCDKMFNKTVDIKDNCINVDTSSDA